MPDFAVLPNDAKFGLEISRPNDRVVQLGLGRCQVIGMDPRSPGLVGARDGGTGECIHHSAEFYGVTIAVGTWDGVLLAANSGGAEHPSRPIAGLGDEAVTYAGTTYMRKGERELKVGINGPAVDGDEAKALSRERALALKVLPNL